MHNIFRTKPVEHYLQQAKNTKLARSLTSLDLILMGVGVIVGTGIFVFTGIGAAKYAGPGLMLSFVLSGFTCALAALAYAELASMVPITGSAYSYASTVLGEIVAWIVGWALILEYSIGAAAVATGWSAYIISIFDALGHALPQGISAPPAHNGFIDLPAVFIVILLTIVLCRGTRESAKLNRVLVSIKLLVVAVFIILAAPKVNTSLWSPLMPFGFQGVITGASVAFFAYIGFDMIANSAEECKNPQKALPIGVLGSLAIVTILYVVVTGIMTGVVPYQLLDTGAPVSLVLKTIGYNFGAALTGIGIVFGLTTVILVLMYSQSRLFMAMSRDGLLPRFVGKIHPKYKTPWLLTIVSGVIIAALSGFVTLEVLAELVNIGTLFAFIAASLGVLILRIKRPDLQRPFKCPLPMITAPLAVICCGYLMINLSSITWRFFVLWLIFGLLIYIFFGYRNSELLENSEQSK